MRFLVRVKVDFALEKEISAKDLEEARKVAHNLEPDEFDNFHNFYEWLGSNWRNIAENLEIEVLE